MDATTTYQHSFRVYAEDVDYMGIVYHANYLRFFERARTEMLRKNDLILSDLLKQDTLFAIYDMHIQYKAPARLDDLLTIETQVQQLGSCSFLFQQGMHNQEKKLICNAKIQVVCVNSDLKPKRFPH
ncbi:tol-pal system-associated acyl-CoA thioesterase [Fluoribacter dumoffii]|uniref:Acyl-CoA thioester hydrolase YbgC n=1 Tax=Fluoribacter dumoffii TaxID=463 RepID=A0A377GAG1_9GAMM|nr:tol-pal system-associated acyl-CoA thioesterase [Fluoribacter dumoffii]KTC90218.1 acyl-CoA thioesterase [Fluoribacter dumoffii NY 23]MCW8418564.1 tol-pal system-associated acyl-CoA thioesterase [Fluoribacter dumoffii]MCW8453594.1 tol-pal system-associated acyl-CoA thioesterase [Fluoribacter dumoffii]MCW8459188.1 tol-pal system-associated acyl-CoA thioesterase [Fluoribacter dumoffii]MCW8482547.1 tol-pal system-associated acyl-CoA thioesterase [Fluoribacter dumoffii]